MKISKRIVLLALISSLFLAGCGEESGFSIAKKVDDNEQQATMGDDLIKDTTDNNATSGATGSGKEDEHKDDVEIKDDVTDGNGQSTGQETTQTVDLGNQVITFTFTFIKSDEEMYANVSFEDDPFDSKYDFSYYTVNEQKLDRCEYRYKEMVDDTVTYKIYLGSNESGTYVLKFFNHSDKQYGRVNVAVKFQNKNNSTPYISVAFNIVKVRVIAISFSVQTFFKKIGEFFSNLLNNDRISL